MKILIYLTIKIIMVNNLEAIKMHKIKNNKKIKKDIKSTIITNISTIIYNLNLNMKISQLRTLHYFQLLVLIYYSKNCLYKE